MIFGWQTDEFGTSGPPPFPKDVETHNSCSPIPTVAVLELELRSFGTVEKATSHRFKVKVLRLLCYVLYCVQIRCQGSSMIRHAEGLSSRASFAWFSLIIFYFLKKIQNNSKNHDEDCFPRCSRRFGVCICPCPAKCSLLVGSC